MTSRRDYVVTFAVATSAALAAGSMLDLGFYATFAIAFLISVSLALANPWYHFHAWRATRQAEPEYPPTVTLTLQLRGADAMQLAVTMRKLQAGIGATYRTGETFEVEAFRRVYEQLRHLDPIEQLAHRRPPP